MDSQDHIKTAPPGHESHGVHVCHKCGWPFPNPHPSAKHRRAHKKVCGTIEGYKLTDIKEQPHLVVSDDEHEQEQHSDEDSRSSSPKVEKRSIEEVGSGGIGERSNRSEDEVFSDTVSEFPDGGFSSGFSPGIKEVWGSGTKSDMNVEQSVEDNQTASESVKIDPTTDGAELPKNEAVTSQIHNLTTTHLVITTPKPDGHGSLNDGLADLPSSKPEALKDDAEIHTSVSEVPQTFEIVKEDKAAELEQGKGDRWISDKSGESVAVEVKLDSSEDTSVSKHNDPIENQVSNVDPISKVEEKEDMHVVSVSNLPVVDHPEIIIKDFKDHEMLKSKLIEITEHDGAPEEYHAEHVVSVGNIPIADQPESAIEGFKGNEMSRSAPSSTLGSGEATKSEEEGNESQENLSSLTSNKLGGTICSSTETVAMEDDLKPEGGRGNLTYELPMEKEADYLEPKATNDEDVGANGLEEFPEPSSGEAQKIQTKHFHEGLGTYSSENLHSDMVSEHTTTGQSDMDPILNSDDAVNHEVKLNVVNDIADADNVVPVTTSADNEIDHSVRSSSVENADDHENEKIEKYAAAGNESNLDILVGKSLTNEQTGYESSESFFVLKIDQPPTLSVEVDAGAHEKGETELSRAAEKESIESAAMGEKIAEPSMAQDHFSISELQDEDSADAAEERAIINETKVQPTCAGSVGGVADIDQDGRAEMPGKNVENTASEVPGTLPVDSEVALKSSTIIENSHTNDNGGDALVVASEMMPQEDVNKSIVDDGPIVSSEPLSESADKFTQQVSVSALDVSVDSSSQTDSLEGNWGSVSVLSTQSDTAAAVDADNGPSTDSSKAFDSGKAYLQKQTTDHQPDKGDVFEPPSFMTLVESKRGVDQKAASREIQGAQNNQQPKSDASQAGWFPSLTNVINESQGRKKNEEMIAKVTNWSTGKQHPAQKTLLSEANAEAKVKLSNQKQMTKETQKVENETAAKNEGVATTVNSILGSEAPKDQDLKKEMGKEWNSPARYPTDEKKPKKKVKGRTHWVPFVCCSSVN